MQVTSLERVGDETHLERQLLKLDNTLSLKALQSRLCPPAIQQLYRYLILHCAFVTPRHLSTN